MLLHLSDQDFIKARPMLSFTCKYRLMPFCDFIADVKRTERSRNSQAEYTLNIL